MEINKLSNIAVAANKARIEPSSLEKRKVQRDPAEVEDVDSSAEPKRIESSEEAAEIANRIGNLVRESGLSAVNAHGFDTERVSALLG